MKVIPMLAAALLITSGCGFVDENIHMSDEELRAELEGNFGYGFGSIGSSGCGIGLYHRTHRHGHGSAHYHFDSTLVRGRPGTEPETTGTPVADRNDEDIRLRVVDRKKVKAKPLPRNIDTWGEMVQWHFDDARRQGRVDARTEHAVRLMRSE